MSDEPIATLERLVHRIDPQPIPLLAIIRQARAEQRRRRFAVASVTIACACMAALVVMLPRSSVESQSPQGPADSLPPSQSPSVDASVSQATRSGLHRDLSAASRSARLFQKQTTTVPQVGALSVRSYVRNLESKGFRTKVVHRPCSKYEICPASFKVSVTPGERAPTGSTITITSWSR